MRHRFHRSFIAALIVVLIATTSAAAVEPPAISPAYPVSDPVYQAAPNGRYAGDVVAGDNGYLAVWDDTRTYETNQSEIYAARIASDGTVLDPGGIRVTSAPLQQASPRVAWSGSEYLVVWTEFGGERASGDDVLVARIAADGTVLDPVGVPIASSPLDEGQADVAWNGSTWVVAWTAQVANGSDIRVEQLSPDLETVGADDLYFAASSYAQTGVQLAVEGTTTVAVYTDARDEDTGDGTNVYMNLLTADGGMLDDGFPIVTGVVNQVVSGIAASPSGVLATWTAFEGGASGVEPVLYARRFIGGAPAGPAIEIASSGQTPRVAWGADGYLVAWTEVTSDQADIHGRLVSLQAVAGDPFPITSGDRSESLGAIAGGPAGHLLVATDKDHAGGAGRQVLGVRLDGGEVLDDPPFRLAGAARPQADPALVDVGGTTVAVWAEQDQGTGWDIRMGRIGSDGSLLDGSGSEVTGAPGYERFPSVAWDGTQLLVTWWDDGDEVGRMLARAMELDGTPKGPPIVLGTGVSQQRAAIASNGPGFAVAWGRRIIESQHELQLQKLDGAGATVGPMRILASPVSGGFVSLAPLGSGFLAAWSTTKVEARRLTADGAPMDPAPLILSSADTDFAEDIPTIASSGNQALVTWVRRPIDQVQAARITAAGEVLDPDPLEISGVVAGVGAPATVWNGLTYESFWWSHPDSIAGSEINVLGEHWPIDVPVDGAVFGVPFAAASGTGGHAALAYGILDLGPIVGGTVRVVAHHITVDRPVASGTSVTISAGASATKTSAVTMSVPALNATHVALSNDNATWTTRAYAPTQTWTLLSGNGTRTVWAKWRDAVGRWSPVKADSIVVDSVLPTSSVPRHAILNNTSLVAGQVPIRVTWSGSDDQAGIARFDIARRTDGGAWVRTSTTSSTVTTTLSPGHLHAFAVRAVDKAGNVGAWAYGPAFRLAAVQQSSSAVRYAGTWATSTSTVWWGGTARSSSRAGATASYTFTGRSIAWVGLKGLGRGKANVYVNGVLKATVDLYSATTKKQLVVWSANYSASATRTITIKVLGTSGRPRVDVDGFIVGS